MLVWELWLITRGDSLVAEVGESFAALERVRLAQQMH